MINLRKYYIITLMNKTIIFRNKWLLIKFYRSFLILLGTFLVVCTIFDAIEKRRAPGESGGRMLQSLGRFSLHRNALAILSTKAKSENLLSIQGLRFFSMVWVVLGHEYVTGALGVNVNNLDILDVSVLFFLHAIIMWIFLAENVHRIIVL